MSARLLAYLGFGCLLGMAVRAPWVTHHLDLTMNLLAIFGGMALLLDRRHARPS